VPEAVRGHLVRDQDQIVRARSVEPVGGGGLRHERSDGGQPVEAAAEGLLASRRDGFRERELERPRDVGQAPVGMARPPRGAVHHERMRSPGFGDHGRIEGGAVVWADEPEVLGIGECKVQERFMPVAFDQLGGAPLGPDRLTDPPQAPPGASVRVGEPSPRGDDPGRVAAELDHVGEPDGRGRLPERLAQQIDLLALTATRIGSSARTASRMNGAVRARKSSAPP
jgi:hypothetical protein